MRILQVHNRYLHYGGEDAVVDNEYRILVENNVQVKQVFFNNTNVSPLTIFSNKSSYTTVKNEILEFKPDVMHVHNIFYQATPSILAAAKETGVPVVMTLHNFRLLCPGGLFLRNSEVCTKCKDITFPYYGVIHKCFQNSYTKSLALSAFLGINKNFDTWNSHIDTFIALTPFIKELLINSSLKLNKEAVIVKPNSTDDFLIENRTFPKREGYLFVGRLSKEKGIDTLIKAFNLLPDFKLEIIGTGELEQQLKNDANENSIFHGMKDRDFIQSKLLTAKALIFPSIWYEGLPNTIIESFSAGTPVLCSNIDNINSIVTDKFNGEVFEPNCPESISKKIVEFDKKDISKYQEHARETYLKYYTHERNFENLKGIYNDVIKKKKMFKPSSL